MEHQSSPFSLNPMDCKYIYDRHHIHLLKRDRCIALIIALIREINYLSLTRRSHFTTSYFKSFANSRYSPARPNIQLQEIISWDHLTRLPETVCRSVCILFYIVSLSPKPLCRFKPKLVHVTMHAMGWRQNTTKSTISQLLLH